MAVTKSTLRATRQFLLRITDKITFYRGNGDSKDLLSDMLKLAFDNEMIESVLRVSPVRAVSLVARWLMPSDRMDTIDIRSRVRTK